MDTRIPEIEELPPEWEALVLAAREIEIENAQERDRADRLARELEAVRSQANRGAGLESVVRDLKAEVESLKSVIQGLHQTLEESKRLRQDLIEVRDRLGGAISSASHQAKPTAEVSASERGRFAGAFKRLLSEVHYLKKILPTETALSLKQAEVEKLKKVYQRLSPNHGERKSIEALLKAQIVERDRIREVHEKLLSRFEQDVKELEKASDALAKGEPPTSSGPNPQNQTHY